MRGRLDRPICGKKCHLGNFQGRSVHHHHCHHHQPEHEHARHYSKINGTITIQSITTSETISILFVQFLAFIDSWIWSRGSKRKLWVPVWVAFSKMTAQQVRQELISPIHDIPLRYDVCEKPIVPKHLQGVSLFRVHQYQCQTSRIIPEVHQQMQMAGAAMVEFLRSLKKNYEAYWGAVGVPQHVQSFYSDLALCWDIPRLLKFPATAPQKDALCRLADASLCC